MSREHYYPQSVLVEVVVAVAGVGGGIDVQAPPMSLWLAAAILAILLQLFGCSFENERDLYHHNNLRHNVYPLHEDRQKHSL